MSRPVHHRRRFRRIVFFFLILLLPVAAWSLWDYIEARRLSTAVREIQSRGEPVASKISRACRRSSTAARAPTTMPRPC